MFIDMVENETKVDIAVLTILCINSTGTRIFHNESDNAISKICTKKGISGSYLYDANMNDFIPIHTREGSIRPPLVFLT